MHEVFDRDSDTSFDSRTSKARARPLSGPDPLLPLPPPLALEALSSHRHASLFFSKASTSMLK